jgi:hypothetical protein
MKLFNKFTYIYLGISVTIGITLGILEMLLNVSFGSSINASITMCAAMFAGHFFVKEHDRIPTKEEQKKLSWGSLILSSFVGLLFMTIAYQFDPELQQKFSSIPLIFLSVVSLIFGIVYYWILRLSYGFFLRKLTEKRLKNK